MSSKNKRNLLYFEAKSMPALFKKMRAWQREADKRLLSAEIHRDGATLCCIALTNPTEVYIMNGAPFGGASVLRCGDTKNALMTRPE